MNLLVTNAGLSALLNAEQTGTTTISITSIKIGTGQYTPTKTQTALKTPIKTLTALSGGAVSANTLHVTAEDASTDTYTVYEVGVFLSDGTLFAVGSQNTPILQKASAAIALLSVDIALADHSAATVTVGDTNFFNPQATTETKGVVELATADETKAGTDATRAVTPASLKAELDVRDSKVVHKTGSETIAGVKKFTSTPRVYGTNPELHLQKSDISKGGTPTSTGTFSVGCHDKNGVDVTNTLATVQFTVGTDGATKAALYAFKNEAGSTASESIGISYPADDTPYTHAPTPSSTADNSTKIATTKWVRAATGNTALNAATATKLAAGKTITTNLASTSGAPFDGSANITPGVTGVLPVANGGTGSNKEKYLQLSGGTLTGNITGDREEFTLLKKDDTGSTIIRGGTAYASGASLILFGKGHENSGIFRAIAHDGTNVCNLLGYPDGRLTWNGKNVTLQGDCLPLSGGTMTGTLHMGKNSIDNLSRIEMTPISNTSGNGGFIDFHYNQSAEDYTSRIIEDASGRLSILAQNGVFLSGALKQIGSASALLLRGDDGEKGAYINLYGNGHASSPGYFTAAARNGDTVCRLVGSPGGSLSWDGMEVERVRSIGPDYIRFDSGLQICWGIFSSSSITSSTTVTFPVAFKDALYIASFGDVNGDSLTAVETAFTKLPVYVRTSASSMTVRTTTSGAGSISYIAIGWWK